MDCMGLQGLDGIFVGFYKNFCGVRKKPPLKGEPKGAAHSPPSPMRGRWHGEAVTDEVGGTRIYATPSTSSVASGDSFPS